MNVSLIRLFTLSAIDEAETALNTQSPVYVFGSPFLVRSVSVDLCAGVADVGLFPALLLWTGLELDAIGDARGKPRNGAETDQDYRARLMRPSF